VRRYPGGRVYGLDALLAVFAVSFMLTVANVWYLLIRRAPSASGTLFGLSTVVAILALASLAMPRVSVEPAAMAVVPGNYTTPVTRVLSYNNTTVTTVVVMTYVANLVVTVYRESGLLGPYFGLVTVLLVVNAFVFLLYQFAVVFPRIVRRL
jgi:hypothetical protein